MSESSTMMNYDIQNKSDRGLWRRICSSGNQGAILILIAEAFASAMDAIARYLQQEEHGFHEFQIIVARMSGTFIFSFVYLWWKGEPHFPLGSPSVRPLLILRAVSGFGGIFCIYYSVHYLPLAEATIFRFLVPLITPFACSILLKLPFTRKDFLLSILALIGIVIIAHPSSITWKNLYSAVGFHNHVSHVIDTSSTHADNITPLQRFLAVVVAMLGVVGGASSYTTIRLIGNRAHALHSIIYYSFLSTISSTFFLLVLPEISFVKPQGLEWIMLISLGVFGFILQFLLTKGLQLDHSSKATSMIYTQVVYAILFDWLIWRVLPDKWDLMGGSIVVGSTLWAALTKPNLHGQKDPSTSEVIDEERPLLGDANMRKKVSGLK